MRKRTFASVVIVLALLFSATMMLWINYPGPNMDQVTADPIVNDDVADDLGAGPASVVPMTSDDGGDDGQTEAPVMDDCGDDDQAEVPTTGDDCSDGQKDDCGCVPEPDCGCEDDEDDCNVDDDCGCDDGCTYTIGYWKNHAGLGHGNQEDMVTPLLGDGIFLGCGCGDDSVKVSDAANAVNYLNRQGDSSNGINRLYAQLLAAKLNIANGASDDAVDGAIADADAFLAEHGSNDWDCLSAEEQHQVNEWKDILDNYNNGIIGPGHCE